METSSRLKKTEAHALISEKLELEKHLLPPPPTWPPHGYERHPLNPSLLYRVVDEDVLREELFGSERKKNWIAQATDRLKEIDALLRPWFFPKSVYKREGVQRIDNKDGFAAMVEPKVTRKFDEPALAPVVSKVLDMAAKRNEPIEIEEVVITFEPKLDLKAFRALPDWAQKELGNCIIEEEKPGALVIVPLNA